MKTLTIALLGAALVAFPFVPALAGDCGSCGGGMKPAAKKDVVDTAVAAGEFETLVAAVKAAGLVDTLKGDGPFTVFAPTDAAFAKLPEGTVPSLLGDLPKLRGILTYHVVPGRLTASQVAGSGWLKTAQGQSLRVEVAGDEVRIDGARVVKADIPVSNGVIHVIDAVVLPRADLVDTAKAAGSFRTLLAAAEAAGLVETLKGEGPFTVFAPSDEAFAKLPEGTVEALLEDVEKLKTVLTYHVVPGRVLSADLRRGAVKAGTANGRTLTLTKSDYMKVRANDAEVVKADILAGNGVIHVVDRVILP